MALRLDAQAVMAVQAEVLRSAAAVTPAKKAARPMPAWGAGRTSCKTVLCAELRLKVADWAVHEVVLLVDQRQAARGQPAHRRCYRRQAAALVPLAPSGPGAEVRKRSVGAMAELQAAHVLQVVQTAEVRLAHA